MRFEPGPFPGVPSSTPGSCRSCGIGLLREGETGYVNTDWWINMEGVVILCEACAREVGSLVPNPERDKLKDTVKATKAELKATKAELDKALRVVSAQREEMSLKVK